MFKDLVDALIKESENKSYATHNVITAVRKDIESDLQLAFQRSAPLIKNNMDLYEKSNSFFGFLVKLSKIHYEEPTFEPSNERLQAILKSENERLHEKIKKMEETSSINTQELEDQLKKCESEKSDLLGQLKSQNEVIGRLRNELRDCIQSNEEEKELFARKVKNLETERNNLISEQSTENIDSLLSDEQKRKITEQALEEVQRNYSDKYNELSIELNRYKRDVEQLNTQIELQSKDLKKANDELKDKEKWGELLKDYDKKFIECDERIEILSAEKEKCLQTLANLKREYEFVSQQKPMDSESEIITKLKEEVATLNNFVKSVKDIFPGLAFDELLSKINWSVKLKSEIIELFNITNEDLIVTELRNLSEYRKKFHDVTERTFKYIHCHIFKKPLETMKELSNIKSSDEFIEERTRLLTSFMDTLREKIIILHKILKIEEKEPKIDYDNANVMLQRVIDNVEEHREIVTKILNNILKLQNETFPYKNLFNELEKLDTNQKLQINNLEKTKSDYDNLCVLLSDNIKADPKSKDKYSQAKEIVEFAAQQMKYQKDEISNITLSLYQKNQEMFDLTLSLNETNEKMSEHLKKLKHETADLCSVIETIFSKISKITLNCDITNITLFFKKLNENVLNKIFDKMQIEEYTDLYEFCVTRYETLQDNFDNLVEMLADKMKSKERYKDSLSNEEKYQLVSNIIEGYLPKYNLSKDTTKEEQQKKIAIEISKKIGNVRDPPENLTEALNDINDLLENFISSYKEIAHRKEYHPIIDITMREILEYINISLKKGMVVDIENDSIYELDFNRNFIRLLCRKIFINEYKYFRREIDFEKTMKYRTEKYKEFQFYIKSSKFLHDAVKDYVMAELHTVDGQIMTSEYRKGFKFLQKSLRQNLKSTFRADQVHSINEALIDAVEFTLEHCRECEYETRKRKTAASRKLREILSSTESGDKIQPMDTLQSADAYTIDMHRLKIDDGHIS